MGEYADVKRNRMLRLIRWLDSLEGFSVDNGGSHQWVVKHEDWERGFPIPFKNDKVSKYIVKDLMKRVVETGACTKDEFDGRI